MAERPLTPLLDSLEFHGVFSVECMPNGEFHIRETSDGCSYRLTAVEITELAGELLALAATASITEPQGE